MRVTLRIIALLAASSVAGTVLFVVRFWPARLPALIETGLLGIMTVAGWAITIVAGPIAAVQLFRLRRSGRLAAIALFGSMLLYYLAGLLMLKEPDAASSPIIIACIAYAIIVGVLLTRRARVVCGEVAAAKVK